MNKTVSVELTQDDVAWIRKTLDYYPAAYQRDLNDKLLAARAQLLHRGHEAKVEAIAIAVTGIFGFIGEPHRPTAIRQLAKLNASGWDLVRIDKEVR